MRGGDKHRKAIFLNGYVSIAVLIIFWIAASAFAQAKSGEGLEHEIRALVSEQFPDADNIVIRSSKKIPNILEAVSGGQVIAWGASSSQLIRSVGYSGKPLDIAVVITRQGTEYRLSGARLIAHSEPVLVVGISDEALQQYIAGFRNVNVAMALTSLIRSGELPQAVSGATVSSSIIRNAIIVTARRMAHEVQETNHNVAFQQAGQGQKTSFAAMLASGNIARHRIDIEDVRKALPDYSSLPEKNDVFADIYFGWADQPSFLEALAGQQMAMRIQAEAGKGERLLFIAANGLYSIKGTSWRKSGVFDRLGLVQGERRITLPADRHERLQKLMLQDAPQFREAMLVFLPEDAARNGEEEIRLELNVTSPEGTGARFAAPFNMEASRDGGQAVALPENVVAFEGWRITWQEKAPQLAVLTVMLTILFCSLYFSGPLVRRPELYRGFRLTFLAVTLIWLGWIAGAQLSIVHVTSFLHALRADFNWEVFLHDPLVFTLWAFLAITVLFWGRGVFCGWLCPFGALQELVNAAARRFKIGQLNIPWEVHERLWPIKYMFLLGIIGLSLQEMVLAFKLAEIEPFKTAITLHFLRPWPFILYVAIILAAALFVERVFCRYLCPLGAALSLPTRFKIFDWLIRRPQCGRECRLCATTCTVQAIDPIGRINANECIYCLRCQVNYHDAKTCVPLKMRAHRRQARNEQATMGPGKTKI